MFGYVISTSKLLQTSGKLATISLILLPVLIHLQHADVTSMVREHFGLNPTQVATTGSGS